ncbi:hypothetical protein DV515_00012041 [Chloebia gouldiae]|uniref:SRCR domain-containing protein n=1 Tax=Chloebia gouldiae TaxID=44316 RepID=A0A3L8S508_CHLGU|nr:hypothetical protein DV515_00012041 [Chloebia gouldiae]
MVFSWCFPTGPILRLTRGGCRCTGILEVNFENQWRPICWESVSVSDLDWVCQQLECSPLTSEPLEFIIPGGKGPQSQPTRCRHSLGCHWELENCTEHVIVACREPVKTTPKPPPTPPATTPEPMGPPRLRLVDGNFSCSGFLELHKQGLWGAVGSIPHSWTHLVTAICRELRCGTAGSSHGEPNPGIHLPVRWEAVDSCGSRTLLDCFNRTSSRGKTPVFITCSGENGASMIYGSTGILRGGFWGWNREPAPSLPALWAPSTHSCSSSPGCKGKQEISVPGSSEEDEPGRERGHGSIPNSNWGWEHWQAPRCGHPAVGSTLSNFHTLGISLPWEGDP